MRCAARVWEGWLVLLSGKGEIKAGYGDRLFSASDRAWGYEFACDALKQFLRLVVEIVTLASWDLEMCTVSGYV